MQPTANVMTWTLTPTKEVIGLSISAGDWVCVDIEHVDGAATLVNGVLAHVLYQPDQPTFNSELEQRELTPTAGGTMVQPVATRQLGTLTSDLVYRINPGWPFYARWRGILAIIGGSGAQVRVSARRTFCARFAPDEALEGMPEWASYADGAPRNYRIESPSIWDVPATYYNVTNATVIPFARGAYGVTVPAAASIDITALGLPAITMPLQCTSKPFPVGALTALGGSFTATAATIPAITIWSRLGG